MRIASWIPRPLVAGVALATAALVGAAAAPAVRRNVVFHQPTTLADRDAVMAYVDLPPGSSEGRHTHAGELFGFVLAGAVELAVEGEAPQILAAGAIYHVAPGKIHDIANRGTVEARTAVVLVAERGKPVSIPVE